MTKKYSTKKALIASVLSLVLCFSMLLGTTFAWFTDSVTSANNIIKSGNLDVELYYQAEGQTDWTKVTNITNVFKENALWEPGHTEVVKLKVVNEGSLALKYTLGVNVASEVGSVNVNDKEFKLSDFIKFGIVDGAQTYTRDQAIAAVDATATALKTAYNSTVTALDAKNDTDSDEKIVTMVVYMPTTVGNDANAKTGAAVPTINLGINLFATQQTAEFDSFNNQYDKDAEFSVDVKNADELANVLKAGGKVKLVGDIQLSNSVEVPAGVAVELDLNGKTITGTKGRDADNNRIHVIVNNGILTIKDGTVKSSGADGGSAIYNNAGATLTIEDVTVYGAPLSNPVYPVSAYPSYGINNYGMMTVNGATIKTYHGAIATGDNGVTVINDADIDVGQSTSTGVTSYAIYSYNNAQVTVNGGKFAFTKQEVYVNGGNTFCELGTNPIIINGGNYIGTSFSIGADREYVIKGGTFDADPSAYVAPGYQVTNNGDGTYTVGAYKISTGAELVDAIANGKAVELTQDINLSKIDLTGAITNDVVINANGHKITTTDAYGIEVTKGKNVTISNANVEMTKAGDYITYAAGFKIANGDYADATITLENCTITMANTDWAYAVTIPASVKNLNLVIDNCTLEGAIAVQCWGDNNTITITNSELICNYTTSALYTSYCVVLQSDGGSNVSENNTLVIDNCEFKYSGVDNFNSPIYSVDDLGTGNTVTVTNCTYGEKVVAD